MSNITSKETEGKLVIYCSGRIDSSNAAEVGNQFQAIHEANPSLPIVLDMDDLAYISSAGLRAVLKLRKDAKELKIVNASSEIYEIFEMTGFTEMITVEKAYRKLSVEGCEAIGRGANGAVYRLDPETIIKVYFNPDALPDISRERDLARHAFVLGIPTAIPYDVVRVGSQYGSVFELLNAKHLAQLLREDPSKEAEIIDFSVDLLKKIHSTEAKFDDIPDMKAVAVNWAEFLKPYLPEDKWTKLVAMIKAVPDCKTMMHGDYHLKNVMLQNGEALLIDMDTLAHGHPIFEFASVFNAYVGFEVEPDHDPQNNFLGLTDEVSERVWAESIKKYFGTEDPAKLREIEDKASLVGYTRLLRRYIRRHDITKPEEAAPYNEYRNRLLAVIDRIDTLEF